MDRMPRDRRLNVRVHDASHAKLTAMATALAGGVGAMPVSHLVRVLLVEALTARSTACGRRHLGPVTGGVCAHCGAEVAR